MSGKTATTEAITMADLKTALRELKGDLRKGLRADIVVALSDFEKRFERKIDAKLAIRFAEFELKMDDKITLCKNELLTRFNSWAAELELAKQDRELSTQHIVQLQDNIANHEKRLTKIEKVLH